MQGAATQHWVPCLGLHIVLRILCPCQQLHARRFGLLLLRTGTGQGATCTASSACRTDAEPGPQLLVWQTRIPTGSVDPRQHRGSARAAQGTGVQQTLEHGALSKRVRRAGVGSSRGLQATLIETASRAPAVAAVPVRSPGPALNFTNADLDSRHATARLAS